MGRQEGGSELVVGLGAGVVVEDVTHEAHRVDRESRQHVVIPCDGVGDVAKGKLPLREPEPRSRVLGPGWRQLDLTNGRKSACRRGWRRLLFVVVHVGHSGSPMSRPMNGKTVEIRLDIFPATSCNTLHRFTTSWWRISSSARSRVDGLHRWVIEGRHSTKYKENDPTGNAAVITLWGEYREAMGRNLIEMNLGLWKTTVLAPDFKNFLFKLVHGKLYLNAQLAHFDDIEPQCTFCSLKEKMELKRELVREGSNEYIRRMQALDRETINHLFWDCRHVNRVIRGFFNTIANENDRNVEKDKYMGGWKVESVLRTKIILILIHFVKYYIYSCRIRRNIPSTAGIMYEYGGLLVNIVRNYKWGLNIREMLECMGDILVR